MKVLINEIALSRQAKCALFEFDLYNQDLCKIELLLGWL